MNYFNMLVPLLIIFSVFSSICGGILCLLVRRRNHVMNYRVKYDITRMDAKMAMDLLDNPPELNQALQDLLKLK